jgi:glutamate-ammonia-ligase adenylyltransferase
MLNAAFLDAISAGPLPLDLAQSCTAIERWRSALLTADAQESDHEHTLDARITAILAHPNGQKLLTGLFSCSPFLAGVAAQEPLFCLNLLEQGPDALWPEVSQPLTDSPIRPGSPNEATAKRAIRRTRRRAALLIAVADVTDTWPLPRVTRALSDNADQCAQYALALAVAELAARGRLTLADKSDPLAECGMFLLGMGKLGAHELNYSSDIDVIALFDPDRVPTNKPDRLKQDMVRLIQRWVSMLQDRTADGFAFRTDLRLRPDPASTAPAISVPAAENYYETTGQNWERAAMIKARVIAGDDVAGQVFLDFLTPFVWRRSLDFWTIRDIHSIKRQINAHRGGSAIAVAGHDIKVGRGGIREIEFYAQTQQLIWGGKNPALRVRPTCEALDALTTAGHVTPEASAELKDAYTYLRRLEHRLQMVADQQTQRMPDADGLDLIARFMGEADTASFEGQVRTVLETVERRYAELFEDEPALSVEGMGNLVFTGAEVDLNTLETLASLGFSTPERIDATVRGWHHGRLAATRSDRARQILTELLPALLQALGNTADPDEAFSNFDHFLHGLPAGVQLFSLFHIHPDMLDLVAEICGSAPWLGQHMRRRPAVLEAVIDPEFLAPLPSFDAQSKRLTSLLADSRDVEDTLDLARQYASDLNFQVGLQLLRHQTSAETAGAALSAMADLTAAAMLTTTQAAFAERHGQVEGGAMALIGYGKWGSRQLNSSSDLDMVVLYDSPSVTAESDGDRPLAASTYATRLTQRLITALSAQTQNGSLFEIDMRLRPDGDKGGLATHIEGFEQYQRNSAWTWEHLALVRARFVVGPTRLAERFEAVRAEVLSGTTEAARLAAEVHDMRTRMAKTYKGDSAWDTKHRRGGLVDTGFLSQFLVLAHAGQEPALLKPRATAGIATAAAQADLMSTADAQELSDAEAFWLSLQTLLRLTGADTEPKRLARTAVSSVIAKGLGLPNLSVVEITAQEHAERVMALYATLIQA